MSLYIFRRAAFSLTVALLAATSVPALAAPPYQTTAKNAILIDMDTGTVLFEKDADVQIHPASMSKLMTTYIVFEQLKKGALKLTDTLPVSEEIWRKWRANKGSTMFLNVGDRPTIEDLVRGIVIQSGNDACDVIAEGLGGSEEGFAVWLNKKAKELGLKGSHFVNASGWPNPEHVVTVRDLATLSERIIRDFPEYYHYFKEESFVYSGVKQGNRNPTLGVVPGADGLKTGHSDEAGYGVTLSAIQNGRRIVAVIAGMSSMSERAKESERVLNYGFNNFKSYKLFERGQMVEEAPLWLGDQDTVPLVADRDVKVLMGRLDRSDLKVKVVYDSPVAAPLKEGQVVGKIVVSVPDHANQEFPLVAGAAIGELSGFGRVSAAISQLIWGPAKSTAAKPAH
ncbi:D-alanyl-D-alanine carboxypeptidase family protein [Govanella unica]|uniref:serine-type D-Ala-D-Ala carboxypeptidase n=1 Tax=Govanella unica TaxID=2975056 RepID=A0A9X3TYG6_9PROT|nr:D-alanyl-D-alanine carboxypeptidase family protein [Govania unica]MDA5193854.1 D-alanyl-D-alanine carboxypeptidase [Govania unica]